MVEHLAFLPLPILLIEIGQAPFDKIVVVPHGGEISDRYLLPGFCKAERLVDCYTRNENGR
jgi:hypothetical protein